MSDRTGVVGASVYDSTPPADAPALVVREAPAAAVKYARINATSDGDNTVLFSVSSRKLVVLGYTLGASGTAGIITIKDSASSVLGQLDLAVRAPISHPGGAKAPAFQTGVGEGLILTTQAGQDVLGHLTYREEAE